MATYKQIQAYVKQRYGYQPKTCWIAHVKELNGLPVRRAHNRRGERLVPCTDEKKRKEITETFRHFKML